MSNKLNITKEDFENKLKELYGGKYELISEFIDHLTDVELFCHEKDFLGEEHGIFKVRPIDIMKKIHGCPRCGGTKKLNTEEWKKRANYVHNDFFIYDEKTVYTGANNKITVKCPYHGYFEIKANNHLNGYNCPMCIKEKIEHKITLLPKINASTKRLTNDEVKKRILEFHPDYDVSKVNYKNIRSKLVLGCPIHGEFDIAAGKALIGRGCRKCAKNYPRDNELFIEDSKRVHGDDAFIYDDVDYKGNHIPVWLTCKKCGHKFSVDPANHITAMNGCPMCATSKLERLVKKMLDDHDVEFISQYKDGLDGLRADFYIPKYNVAIECQGMQHFEPVKFHPSVTDEEVVEIFKKQVERDDKKNKLLNEQGIRLLYFTNCKVEDYRYPLIKDLDVLWEQIILRKELDSEIGKLLNE